MAAQRWMFTTEQLANTPSRKCGIDADKELSYRQQAANLIQDMGQRLSVEQLCINTAIVYMHRFYMFRSFSRFPRNEMAPACLFLAAKVEEQPRKLEHVIKVAYACLNRDNNTPPPDPKTEAYLEQAQQLVINENILLQTLGFEVTVDHPHTHVVKSSTVILAKASKDLSRTSYYLATNSLHMTTMSLQYRPTVVACVCIYMACKWANYKIPRSNEGREWYQYIDPRVTLPQIEELYNEFLNILNKSPMKLKRKIMGWKGGEDERSGQGTLQHDTNRPSTSSHHRPSNADHLDGPESKKHNQHEQKHTHDPHRDNRMDQRKEHRPGDHKPIPSHHPERKPQTSHPQDPTKHYKREDRPDGHSHSQPHRKDVPHHPHMEHRDKNVPHERHKELTHVKKDMNVNGQSHQGGSSVLTMKPHENIKTENKDSPSIKETPVSQSSVQNPNTQHSQSAQKNLQKSKTAIDFSSYVKRKEQEKLDREKERQVEKFEREKRHERERLERERIQKQRAAEVETLNKTFSEGSTRDQVKHRPPKLDISLPLPENHIDQKHLNSKERPYNVNIKSPIKPHHNITVKSPIKSSDLKQPKLELPKVQITPEKDGADPFSVNINTDPAIRKLMEGEKPESENGTFVGETFIKMESNEPSRVNALINEVKIKKELDLEPGEIFEPEIQLNPEHTQAPAVKIRELNFDPAHGLESSSSSRIAVKQEPNSAVSTPGVSHIKQEPGSGSNTPIRLKLPNPGTSTSPSLKIKISTKGLSDSGSHGSSKHSSPHRHKHKHKEKHKHKHSRDKERHREKHREKEPATASSETNGQSASLKLSLKLSDIPGHGVSSEHWSVKNKHDKHKHRSSISDPSLNKSNSLEADRAQPWSVSDLTKSSSSVTQSPSRKRRRTPTVDQNVEQAANTKAAKMGSQRIRRSSSNHSVVSMELSDGEDGQSNGPQEQNTLSLLNIGLMQAIAQTKQKVESLRSQSSAKNSPREPIPVINRQQSGFDLEGMMWAGSVTGEAPPLPPGQPPPPPPAKVKPPPPPSR